MQFPDPKTTAEMLVKLHQEHDKKVFEMIYPMPKKPMPKIIYSREPNFDPTIYKRTKEVQLEYDEHLEQVANHGSTPSEYVLMTEFHSQHQLLALTPNNYPLDLPKGQKHFLLWVKKKIIDAFVTLNHSKIQHLDEFIPDYIFFNFDQDKIIAIYQNDPKNQSVKGLTHYHIIIED
jgi:hypothetical protein